MKYRLSDADRDRVYAYLVLAGHASVLAYLWDTRILSVLVKGVEPICWPYLEQCAQLRFESMAPIALLFCIYLMLVAAGVVYCRRNLAITRYLIIASVSLLFGLMSLDYRFRANEFYMLFWFNAVYLVWPHRRWALPLILISFYFWAGHLKLNYEWISGAVLYHDLWFIPARYNSIACTYVVVLEMVLCWGLLSRRAWVRWAVLVQLGLFHFESLSQIHWFYPLLMTTMLGVFVVENMNSDASRRATLSVLMRGQAPKLIYVLCFVFGAIQLAPALYRGDSTLNGQGRLFTMHMFQARQVCEVLATLHYETGKSSTINLKLETLPPRMVCDPIVYYSRVEKICRDRGIAKVIDADFLMRVKRTTDRTFQTIIDEQNFCDPPRGFSLLANTSWLR
jgi:hypothetical protein